MEQYNKKNLITSGIIATISVVFGLVGTYLTQQRIYMNIFAIVMGLNAIFFSKELALQRVEKDKLNYTFLRWMYLLIGVVFVVINVILLFK